MCLKNEDEAVRNENCVYILVCKDGTLYTGWTNNIEGRLEAHNGGRGAKYTKSRLPVKLAYYEKCDSPRTAMQREYAIKKLNRSRKMELLQKSGSSIAEERSKEK